MTEFSGYHSLSHSGLISISRTLVAAAYNPGAAQQRSSLSNVWGHV